MKRYFGKNKYGTIVIPLELIRLRPNKCIDEPSIEVRKVKINAAFIKITTKEKSFFWNQTVRAESLSSK